MPENEPRPADPQEVNEIPLTECRGRMTMRKVANLDPGAKHTVGISDTTTSQFGPGVTFRVGEKVQFGNFTIRPTRITRLPDGTYRIETARSAYILSPENPNPAPADSTQTTKEEVAKQSNVVVAALTRLVQPWKWFG